MSLLQRLFSGLGGRGKCYYLSVYTQLLQHKGNEAQALKSFLPDFKRFQGHSGPAYFQGLRPVGFCVVPPVAQAVPQADLGFLGRGLLA